jgi:hypothetical protein
MHPFRPAALVSASRFDEGYSEDTRSQSGLDMAPDPDLPLTLPDWLLDLNEAQRSGTSSSSSSPPRRHFRRRPALTRPRFRLCHPALAAHLFHRCHRRQAESTAASRPRRSPAA